jgi:predicted permease
MSTLRHDLAATLRFCNRRRAATAVIVLTLALALAANTAAFAVLKAFLLSSLGVPQPGRLHVITQILGTQNTLDAWPNYLLLRDQARSFDTVAAVLRTDFNWGDGAEVRQVAGARVTANFFRAMRVPPRLGRELAEKEQGPNPAAVVIISHRVWHTAFGGSPDVLDRTMRLNGLPHAVIGVMPEGFSMPPDVDVWVPFDLPPEMWTRIVGGRQLLLFGRLADGTGAAAAQQELKAVGRNIEASNIANKDWSYRSVPVREFFLNGADRTILLVQAGAAVLLLLAATNLSSLLLAWAMERERETAVRLALGAKTRDLARQQAVQGAVLTLAGGTLGLGLAYALLPALRELNPTPTLSFFLQHLRLDPVAAGLMLAVAAALGALTGLVPLWQARRTDLVTALKLESRGGTAARGALRWQKAIVVAQAAITVLVLSAASFAVQGFREAVRKGPGYATEGRGVFRVQLPETAFPDNAKRAAFMRAFAENLAREPELASAGVSNTLPFGDLPTGAALTYETAGGDFTKEPFIFNHRRITVGYPGVMGLPLVRGRHFTAQDDASVPSVALVSQELAGKRWPGADPVGKRFRRTVPGQPPVEITVVGVVGTVRDSGTISPAGETLYVPFVQNTTRKFSVVVQGRGGVESAVAAGVRALRATAPGLAAYDVMTLEKLAWQANATPRLQMVLLTAFAAVAAGVAGLGSYGVMSQLVNNRAREMAVRLAIGDSPAGVWRRVLGQNARLAALGAVLGATAAWSGGSWLQGVVTGVDTKAPWAYLAVLVATVLLTQIASLLPARRAATMDVQRTLSGG